MHKDENCVGHASRQKQMKHRTEITDAVRGLTLLHKKLQMPFVANLV